MLILVLSAHIIRERLLKILKRVKVNVNQARCNDYKLEVRNFYDSLTELAILKYVLSPIHSFEYPYF